MTYYLAFAVSGVVVVFAGMALARYGDSIAEATKIGRVWIGAVLLAGATSLPELATDVAAVRMGAVDLAVGDLFGSGMANMLILAVIDLLPPRRYVLQHVTLDHALPACLAIVLTAIAAVLVIVRPEWTVAWVGPGSLLLFLAYVAGTRAIYHHATRAAETPALHIEDAASVRPTSTDSDAPPAPMSLRRALLGFAIAALVVLAAAPVFAWSAKGIAEITGLGNTFVGTWLVGIATSLPELAACIAAVRMGSFDLAVGNLFGSNAFNMAIFLPLDAVEPGSLFAKLDPSHTVSALFTILLMGLGLAAIVYRAKRRYAMLEPSSSLMVVTYVAAIWLLYTHTAGSGP